MASQLDQTDSRPRLTEHVNLCETRQDTDLFISLFHMFCQVYIQVL